MRRQAGWEGLVALNRWAAGSAQKVAGLTGEEIRGQVEMICGWTGNDGALDQALAQVVADQKRCGILPGGPWPEGGQAIAAGVWFAGGQEGMTFKVQASRCPLFVLSEAEAEAGPSFSALFQEHLPGHTYRGQRWGLRVAPDSVSLYDFATNQLLGLWVAGFTEETDACAGPDGVLVFRVQKGFLPPGAPGGLALP